MNNLLIDVSQVTISVIMRNINETDKNIKAIFYEKLRYYKTKFSDYSNIVICCDSKSYWRKDIFPHYKGHRKSLRDQSTIDWKRIFSIIDDLKTDIRENFPYKILEIEGSEADDIIAILSGYLPNKTLILSSDGDYKQLQKLSNVKQYNPALGVYVKSNNPALDLKEKIIKGDKGDNIPSILSNDDIFLTKQRQSPITKKKLYTWLNEYDLKSIFTEDQYRNYKRNDMLINFDNIPESIKEKIITEYNNLIINPKSKLYDYFLKNKYIMQLSQLQSY